MTAFVSVLFFVLGHGVHMGRVSAICGSPVRVSTGLGGSAWDYYMAMVLYFRTTEITWHLIERAKKLLDKKIARTKYRWDTIEATRHNYRNN